MILPRNIDASLLEQLGRRVTAFDTDVGKLEVVAPFTGEIFGSLPGSGMDLGICKHSLARSI